MARFALRQKRDRLDSSADPAQERGRRDPSADGQHDSAQHSTPLESDLISPETLMFSDHRRGFRATRRGEQAIEAFQEADKLDAMPRQVEGDDVVYRREAEKFRAFGESL